MLVARQKHVTFDHVVLPLPNEGLREEDGEGETGRGHTFRSRVAPTPRRKARHSQEGEGGERKRRPQATRVSTPMRKKRGGGSRSHRNSMPTMSTTVSEGDGGGGGGGSGGGGGLNTSPGHIGRVLLACGSELAAAMAESADLAAFKDNSLPRAGKAVTTSRTSGTDENTEGGGDRGDAEEVGKGKYRVVESRYKAAAAGGSKASAKPRPRLR